MIGDDYPARSCAPAAGASGGRTRTAGSTSATAGGRKAPRRSEDLAWPRARRPARPRQHADPGLPDGGGDQPQAARGPHTLAPIRAFLTPQNRPSRPEPRSEPHTTVAIHSARPHNPADSPHQTKPPKVLQQPPGSPVRNALAHVPKGQHSVVAAAIRRRLQPARQRNRRRDLAPGCRPTPARWPKLAALMDETEADVLAYMSFPRQHRTKLHSTNPLERVNSEIKRSTEVVGIFPNEAAITRLVGAILLEQNDEWAVQRARYMTLETIAPLRDDLTLMLPAAAAVQADAARPGHGRPGRQLYTTPGDTAGVSGDPGS